VALLPLRVSAALLNQRTELEAALEKGMVSGGRPIVGAGEARVMGGDAAASCLTPECWTKVGRTLGVEYVVAGAIEEVQSTFKVTLRLVRVDDGQVLGLEENECSAVDCGLTELVRLSGWELVRKALATKPEPRVPVVHVREAGVVDGPVASIARASTQRPRLPTWLLPAVALGTGTVFVGVGAALLGVADRDANCDRREGELCNVDSTARKVGWISLASGLVAAGVGTLFLIRGETKQLGPSLTVAVANGQGGLVLSGRY
jgi:hypothetical protein